MKTPPKRKNVADTALTARIAQLVGRVGGNQAELARRSGLSPSAIQSYLNGAEPGLSSAGRLANGAQVRIEWLMTGAGSPDEPARKPNDLIDQSLMIDCVRLIEGIEAQLMRGGRAPLETRVQVIAGMYDAIRTTADPSEIGAIQIRHLQAFVDAARPAEDENHPDETSG